MCISGCSYTVDACFACETKTDERNYESTFSHYYGANSDGYSAYTQAYGGQLAGESELILLRPT